jgi:hypothetical protein
MSARRIAARLRLILSVSQSHQATASSRAMMSGANRVRTILAGFRLKSNVADWPYDAANPPIQSKASKVEDLGTV